MYSQSPKSTHTVAMEMGPGNCVEVHANVFEMVGSSVSSEVEEQGGPCPCKLHPLISVIIQSRRVD